MHIQYTIYNIHYTCIIVENHIMIITRVNSFKFQLNTSESLPELYEITLVSFYGGFYSPVPCVLVLLTAPLTVPVVL